MCGKISVLCKSGSVKVDGFQNGRGSVPWCFRTHPLFAPWKDTHQLIHPLLLSDLAHAKLFEADIH